MPSPKSSQNGEIQASFPGMHAAVGQVPPIWFRHDLRSFGHAALHYALKPSRNVFYAFVFDKEIPDTLPRSDRRIEFMKPPVAKN